MKPQASLERIIKTIKDEIIFAESCRPEYCRNPELEIAEHEAKIRGMERILELVEGFRE